MDVGDICDPLNIRTVSVEVPVKQVFILVNLLAHLHPLPASADLGKHTVLLHHSQYRFGMPVDPLALQPQPRPAVAAGLADTGLLLLEKLTQFSIRLWPFQTMSEIIITASGDTKE